MKKLCKFRIMEGKERYCYNHNIIFDTTELFEQHQILCASQRAQPRLCKQHANDGSMCGVVCPDLEQLRVHCLEVHRVHICITCDAQSVDPMELEGHDHLDNEVSIHSGRWINRERIYLILLYIIFIVYSANKVYDVSCYFQYRCSFENAYGCPPTTPITNNINERSASNKNWQ